MPTPPLAFDEETVDQRSARVLPSTAQRSHPVLTWTDSAGVHSVVVANRMIIGSTARVDIMIADPAVSRLHAEVEPRDDGLWVRDLRSRNGTFVEEVFVTVARVPDGGRLRVGSTILSTESPPTTTSIDLWPADRYGQLLGRSVAMRELFARLDRLAKSDSTVLIEAETGTGKELVARALHEASTRAAGPYVIVDCAALPENLLESELFGHAKGAFTGAVGARAGAIEAADGGTVFLDEVGELPLAMQPKLLRAIESRQVRRLGETAHRKIDVRFVSATHRDLRTMVNAGGFREDLYFRLAVLPISIPPLRSRVEDIGLLVQHFLGPNATEVIGTDLLRELASRPWLGNVRELRNFVERARALGIREALSLSSPTREAQTIAPGDPNAAAARRSVPPPIPAAAVDEAERARATAASGVAPSFSPDRPFREVREEWSDFVEREYLRRQLERHGRNIAAVAQAAGLDRTYVYKLIRRHDL